MESPGTNLRVNRWRYRVFEVGEGIKSGLGLQRLLAQMRTGRGAVPTYAVTALSRVPIPDMRAVVSTDGGVVPLQREGGLWIIVTHGWTENVQQVLDYFPYGSPRINSGSDVSQRKYIGQFTDPTGIDYFNARYLNANQGQFISQDPVFLGDPKQQNLQNPQSLNTYSYSQNNPITKKDPSGRCLEDGCVAEAGALGAVPGCSGGVPFGFVALQSSGPAHVPGVVIPSVLS
jgi:RHS repeat-associated protein